MTGQLTKTKIRGATVGDIDYIVSLVNGMASKQLMLPRSKYKVCTMLSSFRVVVDSEDRAIACGACTILWSDLGEVCSLAVDKQYQGNGFGYSLVESLIDEAKELRLPKLITLTYQVDFFRKLGFVVTDRDAFPRKVWRECLECPKLENCDETAMVLDLN